MLVGLARTLIMGSAVIGLVGGSGLAQSATTTVTIIARDATIPGPAGVVENFKWQVNLDNSHAQPSLENPASFSPVVATGDQDNASVTLPATVAPDRGYLVTVFANDGVGALNDPEYKIGGTHFSIPDSDGQVVVELQPNPLPLAMLKVKVFHDNASVNSEEDIPVEEGLEGFHITLADRVGEVVTDWYGNPTCTEYERNADGEIVFDADGNPVIAAGSPGFCVSGPGGEVTIPNLGPDKYEVQAIPPDGSSWIQTTTIEGTLSIDAWIEEGAQGFGTERDLLPSPLWFGFVRPCSFGDHSDDCTSATADAAGKSGRITGRIRQAAIDNDAPGLPALANPVSRPYVSLSNIGGDDEQVWTGRGNADGTFAIPNVPEGLYQMAIWDRPLDHIIQFVTVEVTKDDCVGDLGPCTVALGDLGVPRWFGTIKGSVYIDANENGIRDAGERGFVNQDLDTRFKEGTIQYATFSDPNGNYVFPEVFELEHFAIAEVGYGRFKNTGAASYATDDFGNPLNYPDAPINQDLGLAGLLQAQITWAGLTQYIDWGKKAFAPGENGGIVGIVFNATTRNELDARLQAPEDYEPGVPGATINLYKPALDASGDVTYDADTGEVVKDHLANVYSADSWYDSLPTDCIPIGSIGRAPNEVQPFPQIWEECLELPAILNQVRPGVFDGGYAFEEDCSNPDATDPFDPGQLLDSGAGECIPVPAGKWVVEVVPPDGYKPVKEEDINVFGGDQFVPAVPPPPCAGPMHTVDVVDDPAEANFDPADPSHTQGVYNPDFLATPSPLAPDGGSPYEGERRPLCNARLIDLENGFNANSDFFVFTDVPAPGRLRGLLLDDLNLELDPDSPLYAEKRGIPNAPVGILDFSGNEVARTYSDANGYWEVLLPSTGTYNCPLPAGPCPGMYQVVGNYPGTVDDPDPKFNPNYAPLKLVFDVWPGLTTVADVATLPITSFVQNPDSQFETPPVCAIPGTTPDVRRVSQPYGGPGSSFTITGTGFGASQGSGSVTLGGAALDVESWAAASIDVTIPAGHPVGPQQLLVTADNGEVGQTGITFHVLGAGYSPPLRHVGAGQPYATIQAALDDASDGDLVLVHPGSYAENLLVDEKVKLQGYGPGATFLDGHFFNFTGISSAEFSAKVAATPFDGPPNVPQGQAITILAEDREFTDDFNAAIDGFHITGGTVAERKGVADLQGGAIYAHAYARHLQISNNLIQGSAGIEGGGIVLGRAYVENPDAGDARDSENDFVRVVRNRVVNNGGARLAGGIAIFNGAEGYEIAENFICGNYSAEYGGGISHFGFSSGSIHDNAILFNYAFDEGGGVMIGGELAPQPQELSAGSGDVTIERNRIQSNVSNDDGGGIRLLQPVAGRMSIANNMVVNNLATDTGGGLALDDALDVRIVNNTIARNISTATAEDADRSTCDPSLNGTCPHGAGLVSESHSQALLDAIEDDEFDCGVVDCESGFSNPTLLNDIFWQNEAFYLDGTTGIQGGGLPSAGFHDLEVLGPVAGNYDAHNSVCTTFTPDCPETGSGNIAADPQLVQAIATQFEALAFAGDPNFITVLIKSVPGDPQGNYHLTGTSPAIDAGAASFDGVAAPSDDFDGDGRPIGVGFEIGADERPLTAPPAEAMQFLSFAGAGTAGGTTFADEDVLSFDGASFALVFDGSDVGVGGRDLDAFAKLDSNSFLMSFDAPLSIGSLGTIDDSDVVRFDATSLGSTTAGTFRRYFDGSDVGLTTESEDVDAIELRLGRLFVSTTGPVSVPGAAGADEDLLRFAPRSLGRNTRGSWSMYFDGSDVRLAPTGGEDVDAAAVVGRRLYLSTTGSFAVPGRSGADEDVFACTAAALGPVTSCVYSSALAFDGSSFGLGANDVDALERS